MVLSLSSSYGVFRPEDIAIVRNVVDALTSEDWFSQKPEKRMDFARYVLKMYARGLVVPSRLEALCRLAAQRHFADDTFRNIAGRHILVVEDEYLLAREASLELKSLGAEVIGPVGSVSKALEAIENPQSHIDAALLDIALAGEMVFPVAALLKMKRIPFVFVSDYDERRIPPSYRNTPTYRKPANWASIVRTLADESVFRTA